MKIKVYTVDVQLPRWLKRLLALSALTSVAAIAVVAVVRAAPATVPNTFVDGDTLSAVKLNANFTALTSQLDATNGALATVQQTMVAKDANGNVGIGTSNPRGKLDVVGGRSYFSSDSNAFAVGARYASTGGPVFFGATNDTETPDAQISAATGQVLMTLQNGGNVGVGTAAPFYRLTIQHDNYNGLQVVGNSANSVGISIKNTVANGEDWSISSSGGGVSPVGSLTVYSNTSGAVRAVVTSSGNFGIRTGSPEYALDVAGTIRGDNLTPSDRSLKKSITPLPADTLSRIQKLDAVTFEWNQQKTSGFSKKPQVGLIAQDVEKVFPSLVETDSKGIKSIHYMGVTAVLLEAVKAQQKQIEDLKIRIQFLEGRLSPTASAATKPATGRRWANRDRPSGSYR